MDRPGFADCGALLASLVLAAGCGTKPSAPPPDHAPLVLAELQAASPGPWRHEHREPIAVSALDRSDAAYPSSGEPAAANRPQPQWSAPPSAGGWHDDATDEAPRKLPPLPATPALGPSAGSPASTMRSTSLPRTLLEYSAPRQVAAALPPGDAPSADQRGTLPWAHARRQSPALDSARQAAGDHVQNGFRLAERNALYLARAEFIAALELVAEANDVQQHSRFYTDALNAGLLALSEGADFARQRPVGSRLDVARIVSGHKTPLLKQPPHNRLAPTLASERYYHFAQEQLAAAAAMEPAASMALFGLGKVAIATGKSRPAERLESTDQASALYQAALLADPRNFRAAGELGAILARKGELNRSRDLLLHSVRLAPHPTTHRNLAAVYAKLGQPQMAERANSEAAKMEQAGYGRRGPAVQWLDPATFASTAPASDSLLPPAAAAGTPPRASAPEEQDKPAAETARRSLSDWLPWSSRR